MQVRVLPPMHVPADAGLEDFNFNGNRVMRFFAVAAVAAALLLGVPAAASATEPEYSCPEDVAKAQAEFDDAVRAAEARIRQLGGSPEDIARLLALVQDNNVSPEDQAEARRIYESSGFRYDWSDPVGDLAKINRILDASAELEAAKAAKCLELPPRPEAPADPDLSQIGKAPVGGVQTGIA